MHFRIVATASLVVIAGTAAIAQEPRRLAEAESIPVELATALAASGGFGSEPQILVGSLPEWAVSRLVVPQGGTLVGSAFLGSTVVAVVTAPGGADSAVSSLRKELLQRGWKNPPPPPAGSGGGFRPAQAAPSALVDNSRSPLCGDQQMLTMSGVHRRTGGSVITYRLVSPSGYTPCHLPEAQAQTYRSPFPTLYNPPAAGDAYMAFNCASAPYSGTGTSTVLRLSMTSESLLDHYGRQIADSGWTAANTIVTRTWTKKDSTGSPIELTLTVAPNAQDTLCKKLDLQVKTFRKP